MGTFYVRGEDSISTCSTSSSSSSDIQNIFHYIDHVRTYPTFRFGGVDGTRVSTVAFLRASAWLQYAPILMKNSNSINCSMMMCVCGVSEMYKFGSCLNHVNWQVFCFFFFYMKRVWSIIDEKWLCLGTILRTEKASLPWHVLCSVLEVLNHKKIKQNFTEDHCLSLKGQVLILLSRCWKGFKVRVRGNDERWFKCARKAIFNACGRGGDSIKWT